MNNDIAQLQARIVELTAIVDRLRMSVWFGCLNRNGLNEALKTLTLDTVWFDYFDVDNLRGMNDLYGKPRSSQMIAECIQPRTTDVLAFAKQPTTGQWFSGDEFVTVCWSRQDAIGYAQRVQGLMHDHGFSATHVVLPALYKGTISATLEYADAVITYLKKKKDQRDCIVVI